MRRLRRAIGSRLAAGLLLLGAVALGSAGAASLRMRGAADSISQQGKALQAALDGALGRLRAA